jgi:sugar/nucleoside kinase (ribokinase family)
MIHVVGHTATDYISRVHHLPEKNCSTHISERQIYFGGGQILLQALQYGKGDPYILYRQ